MSFSDYSLKFLDQLGPSFSEEDVERAWRDRYFPLICTNDFKENWMAVEDPKGLFMTPSKQRCRVQALPHHEARLQIMTSDEGGSCLETIPYEAIIFSKFVHQLFCDVEPGEQREPDTVKRRRFINTFVSKLPNKWRCLIIQGDLHLHVDSRSESPQSLKSDIYQPLANPKNIRLLELKPNPHSYETIDCTLVESELPSATSYEALSYVWGKGKSEHSIMLNGKKFPVMENLAAALRQLRPRGQEPRVLWVDAVCIDQSNIQERTEQVAQMDAVYSNAASVVVWLGRETNTSAVVFDGLNQMKRLEIFKHPPFNSVSQEARLLEYPFEVPYYPSLKLASPHLLAKMMKLLLPRYPELASHIHLLEQQRPWNTPEFLSETIGFYEGMTQLLFRPWWTRVWVLQELTLAKKASLHCGSSSVDWELFQAVLFSVIREGKNVMKYHDSSESYAQLSREHKAYIDLSQRAQSVLPFFFLQKASIYASEVPKVSMANLLSLTWDFEATDPRDRLYALIGLLPLESKVRQDLRPEYRTNMRRLCIKAAKHFIETSRSLDALIARPALPYYIPASPLCEVPSWVPNWAAPQVWAYNSIWIGTFHPAKTLDLYMQNSAWSGGPARSTGHQASIDHSSDVDERLQIFNAGLSRSFPLNPKFSSLDEVLQLQGVTVDTIDEFGACLDFGIIAAINMDVANPKTMIEKCNEQRSGIIEGWKHIARVQGGGDYAFARGQSCCEAFWRTLLVDRYWVKGETETAVRFNRIPKEDKGQSFESVLASSGFPSHFPPQTPEDESSINSYIFDESKKLWERASINPHCSNFVLFRTEKGYIGLGHPNLRRGDKIVVLCTAPAPVVLREYSEGHTLIGQSYLHGIMDGEAMLKKDSDGEWRETKQYERFNLI